MMIWLDVANALPSVMNCTYVSGAPRMKSIASAAAVRRVHLYIEPLQPLASAESRTLGGGSRPKYVICTCNVNVEFRSHFTNKSVAGAPYSIKSYSLSHSWTLW